MSTTRRARAERSLVDRARASVDAACSEAIHSPGFAPAAALCADRIAALVPPPRVHRHRDHGVLAPNSPLRDQVTALIPETATDKTALAHSVVTAFPVVGRNRPPNAVLHIGLPEHPESPCLNACMRRHASSPAPT